MSHASADAVVFDLVFLDQLFDLYSSLGEEDDMRQRYSMPLRLRSADDELSADMILLGSG